MPVVCKICSKSALLKRPKTGDALCRECFFLAFENEVHRTITKNQLFTPGEMVAIAASGGKDSTVLAYVLRLLNEQHNYGLKLILLSIDEGITGYRDDSLEVNGSPFDAAQQSHSQIRQPRRCQEGSLVAS